MCRCESDGLFVVNAADRICDHLIFVDDEKSGAIAGKQASALCLERGNDDAAVEAFRKVTRSDANFPSATEPLGAFVIGERACGDREDGLSFEGGCEQLEDECFTRARWGVNDHIHPFAECAYGVLLPKIGDGQGLERGGLHGLNERGGALSD